MFYFFAGLLLVFVALYMVYPLWQKTKIPFIVGDEAVPDAEKRDLIIEKQGLLKSLVELEANHAEAKILPMDYSRLKLEYENRLVAVLNRLDHIPLEASLQTAGGIPLSRSRSLGLSFFVGLLVMAGASSAYALIQWKLERPQQEADGGGPINPAEMVARLEKRLKENPNNIQDQMMAGRSYMVFERWEEAKAAWLKVLELDERNHTAHYALGEILIRTASPKDKFMYEEALEHFDQALVNVPQDSAVLWARGIALLHLDRHQEADDAWTAAFQNIPPDTESSEMVKKALEALRSGKPIS